MRNIPFIDLKAQNEQIKEKVDIAIAKVLEHQKFIMGPEVALLEEELSKFCGSKYSITCSSGTDALLLVLMAKSIKKGDAVFLPSFTFCATAEVVALCGAEPVFVDVLPDTFNIDPKSLESGIKLAKEKNLEPKGIIAVDLFGQPADYDIIENIANENNLWILDDACQGFGGVYKGRKIGSIGMATATSFFPAKPLGCYGDGGAIFTDDENLVEIIKSLRVHGKGKDKYDNIRIGMNGRLDTIQAAILLEKLKIFSDEIKKRQEVANRYSEKLKDYVKVPFILDDTISAWAQYSILVEENRDDIMKKLKDVSVPSVVYYPTPLHMQTAYKNYLKVEDMSVCEKLSKNIFSLPMHPYLSSDVQDYIIENLKKALK